MVVTKSKAATVVQCSNKPTVVISGHHCGQIPPGQTACDHLAEQIPPHTTWGYIYLSISFKKVVITPFCYEFRQHCSYYNAVLFFTKCFGFYNSCIDVLHMYNYSGTSDKGHSEHFSMHQ